MDASRAEIWFDGPDEAYLVAAAIRRHLNATVVSDILLVPTAHGPTIELSASAASDPLVQALVKRFGGRVDVEAAARRVNEVLAADPTKPHGP